MKNHLKFWLCSIIVLATSVHAVSLEDFIYNSSGNFYEIRSTKDMQTLAIYLKDPANQCFGKTFKVTVPELDFSGIAYEPIGKMEDDRFVVNCAFSGTFDGQGVIIKNLVINETESQYTGLFACLYQGSIENVILDKSCQITGISYVGGIVGECSNGTIKNCTNNGQVINTDESDWVYTGGIVGSISDYGTYVASVIGSINNGVVTGNKFVGGIAGMNHSIITGCLNTGAIQCISVCGGIVGSNQNKGNINSSTNKGDVGGNGYLGGIVGQNYGVIHDNKVSECNITHSGNNYPGTGAIIGSNSDDGILYNNYYDEDVQVIINSNVYSGSFPRGAGGGNSPVDIEKTSIEGETYYHCAVPSSYMGQVIDNEEKATLNSLTYTNGYYEINSAEDIITLAKYVNQGNSCSGLTFKVIVSEIDFSNIDSYVPIGYYNNNNDRCPFSGVFDGQGVIIRNLIISENNQRTMALFGYGVDCNVSNITIDSSCSINGTMYIAGIMGYSKNGLIVNCHNKGSIFGPDDENANAGGVVGRSSGTIEKCSNEGHITGRCYLGGIVGDSDGTISECVNKGMITQLPYSSKYVIYIGGIAGSSNYGATIINCQNYGLIEGNMGGGGIVGDNDGHIKENILKDCTNYGDVKCSKGFAGGIAGSSVGLVKDCVNKGCIEGQQKVGGIIGHAGVFQDPTERRGASGCINYGNVIGYRNAESTSIQGIGGIVGTNDNSSIDNCNVSECTISGVNHVGAIAGEDYIGDDKSGGYKINLYLSENYYSKSVVVIVGNASLSGSTPRGVGNSATPFDVTTKNGAVLDINEILEGDINGDNKVNVADIVKDIKDNGGINVKTIVNKILRAK